VQGKARSAPRDAPWRDPVRRLDGSPSPGQFSTCTPHFARSEGSPRHGTHSIETQLSQNIRSCNRSLPPPNQTYYRFTYNPEEYRGVDGSSRYPSVRIPA